MQLSVETVRDLGEELLGWRFTIEMNEIMYSQHLKCKFWNNMFYFALEMKPKVSTGLEAIRQSKKIYHILVQKWYHWLKKYSV